MAMTVDKWSPFVSLQKERLATQAGVKKWEDIFLQPYETAAQQAQTQAAYDISGAFAQYKQSELAAMRNTQLGSGFKEQIASDLAAQYGSAFSQIKQQEASNIYDIQQQASKTLATQEAALAENAKSFAGIEESIFEQHGIDLERARASENAVIGKDQQGNDIYGLGYYELQPDGSYKITERGIDFFDKAFNQGLALTNEAGEITGYEQLADYLKNTGREDLYDFYVQNLDTTREFIGGVTSRKYDESRGSAIKERDYQAELTTAKTRNDNIVAVGEFTSTSKWDGSGYVTVSGKKYQTSGQLDHRTESKILSSINANRQGSGLSRGDIIQYEGEWYVIGDKGRENAHTVYKLIKGA